MLIAIFTSHYRYKSKAVATFWITSSCFAISKISAQPFLQKSFLRAHKVAEGVIYALRYHKIGQSQLFVLRQNTPFPAWCLFNTIWLFFVADTPLCTFTSGCTIICFQTRRKHYLNSSLPAQSLKLFRKNNNSC